MAQTLVAVFFFAKMKLSHLTKYNSRVRCNASQETKKECVLCELAQLTTIKQV